MIKVVYNTSYGVFSLSQVAVDWLEKHGVMTDIYSELPRHHPLLVQCVEELGSEANGEFAKLAIYKLTGNQYRIDEYDGLETVAEPDSYKWIVVE